MVKNVGVTSSERSTTQKATADQLEYRSKNTSYMPGQAIGRF